MKRLLLALALFALPIAGALTPPAQAVVATTKVTLNATTWTDLGVGPLLLTSSGNVVYAVADTTPALVAQGFPLQPNVNQVVNTASHVWVMARDTFPAYVFVSPIVGSSGGSGGSGAITAGTTATSGFTAGQFLMSNGSVVQPNDLFTAVMSPTNGPAIKLGTSAFYMGGAGPGLIFTTDNTNGSGAWMDMAILPTGINMGLGTNIGWSPNGYTGAPTVQLGYTIGSNYRMYLSNAGGSPVAFDVYNKAADPNNAERGTIDWVTTPNVLTIGTQATGTGTARGVQFVAGGFNYIGLGTTVGYITIGNGNGNQVQGMLPNGDGVGMSNGNINFPWGVVASQDFMSAGATPTLAGTCTTGTKVGGMSAGTFQLTGACAAAGTIIFTGMFTGGGQTGYACDAENRSLPAMTLTQTASTSSGFTLTAAGTSGASGNVIQWKCIGY